MPPACLKNAAVWLVLLPLLARADDKQTLGVTYAIWALVIAILIPLAHWFAGVKHRRRDWWLSYL